VFSLPTPSNNQVLLLLSRAPSHLNLPLRKARAWKALVQVRRPRRHGTNLPPRQKKTSSKTPLPITSKRSSRARLALHQKSRNRQRIEVIAALLLPTRKVGNLSFLRCSLPPDFDQHAFRARFARVIVAMRLKCGLSGDVEEAINV
jgi:hypothetical protein